MSNIGDIIYREIRPGEVPVFVNKFGNYIVRFNIVSIQPVLLTKLLFYVSFINVRKHGLVTE